MMIIVIITTTCVVCKECQETFISNCMKINYLQNGAKLSFMSKNKLFGTHVFSQRDMKTSFFVKTTSSPCHEQFREAVLRSAAVKVTCRETTTSHVKGF